MKKYKKYLLTLFLSFLLCFNGIYVFGAEEHSWYIKRQGHDMPLFPNNADILDEYDAYFVDKNAYERGEKIIYLTFDAGYENGNISKILDVLRAEQVPSAFFILDNIIYKNPELVKRMADEGHLVCNHTKKHKNHVNSTVEEIREDLYSLEKLCEERCGVKMARYFRFPEGRYSIESLEAVKSLGYKTFFWSFGYDDWDNGRQPQNEKSIKKILDNTHNGEILLLHPTSKTNAEILSTLIKEWRNMGYSFGRLDAFESI